MTYPAPDKFGPYKATDSSTRQTAPLVGGHAGVHPETYARALGGPRRGDVVTDDALSAEIERRKAQARRRLIRFQHAVQAVGGQTTVLFAGGPHPGFTWDVRRLNVGPMDYSAGSFPTGILVIAIITVQEEPGAPIDDAGRVVSMTTAYPAEGTWGRGECSLVYGDHLRVLVTGLANGTWVTLGGQAEQVGVDTATSYGL